MDNHTLFTSCKCLLLLALCSVLQRSDGFVRLAPTRVTVNESQIAVFNCSLPCDRDTHDQTIIWIVGHFEWWIVGGDSGGLTDESGLEVEVEDVSDCSHREAVKLQQLRINASSAELFNRTSVQCFASPLFGEFTRQYSAVGVMLIRAAEPEKPEQSVHPTPSPSRPGPTITSSQVCPSPVVVTSLVPMASPTPPKPCPAAVTQTQVVSVTKEVLIHPAPTSSPLLELASRICPQLLASSSSLKLSSSLFSCTLTIVIAVLMWSR